MIDHYRWAGGSEAMLRFGPAGGALVIVAPPLFEEANRTRAFLVETLRALAARGMASVLPDLPGQGESLLATEHARLADWRLALSAAAAAAGNVVGTVAVRGGTLLDTDVACRWRWRFAPVDGAALVRELWRTHAAAGEKPQPSLVGAEPVEIAGNRIAPDLLAELQPACPAPSSADVPVRTVRLSSDPRPADLRLEAAPLWRRSEPETDTVLSQLLADDIAEWMADCVA